MEMEKQKEEKMGRDETMDETNNTSFKKRSPKKLANSLNKVYRTNS